MNNKAVEYANDVLNNKYPTNVYIKRLCRRFLDELEHQNEDNFKYFFNEKKAKTITNLMKLINFATGSVAGKSTFDACVGYQFFFILNIFCWVEKENPKKRRYETAILHIARKNSKTTNNALIMILLMLLEPKYSEFYVCANTREQAKLLFTETRRIIDNSPALRDRFIVQRDLIKCKLNENTLKALSSDYNTTDGLRVSAAVIDEVGAAKNSGLIESMRSGMLSVQNRLLVMISTSYPNLNNPFLEWCTYSQKVLDGSIDDDSVLPMLYSLDVDDELTPDNFIKANPLQATLKDGRKYLESEYKRALEQQGDVITSFYCKHLNRWLEGSVVESYVDIDVLRKCENKEPFDWSGKDVYLGIDLSQTTDLTAVAMCYYDRDNDIIYAKAWGFLPYNAIERKSKKERVDYKRLIQNGDCFACGEDVIDYGFVEDFILSLEDKYDVRIVDLGYDRYNAISTISKLMSKSIRCTEIAQFSRYLHSPTKLLEERILCNKFRYDKSKLLEINFANCRVKYDTNLRKYLHKNKSENHMIDLVVAMVNALKILEEEELARNEYFIQNL